LLSQLLLQLLLYIKDASVVRQPAETIQNKSSSSSSSSNSSSPSVKWSTWSCCGSTQDVSTNYEPTKLQSGGGTNVSSKQQATPPPATTTTTNTSTTAKTNTTTITVPTSVSTNNKRKYRCFLTHNWGSQRSDGNFDNHERVRRIYSALQQKGVPCWFDSDRMTGTIIEQMSSGIDDSDVVVGNTSTNSYSNTHTQTNNTHTNTNTNTNINTYSIYNQRVY